MVGGMDHVRQKLSAAAAAVVAALVVVVGVAACGVSPDVRPDERSGEALRASIDSANRLRTGYVIDSILPPEAELARFRAAVGGAPVTELGGAARSRSALVDQAMSALLRADTATLSAITLTAREFADLVYSESRYARAPYRQSPALAWMLIQNPSRTGRARATERIAGLELRLLGHSCRRPPEYEGRNTVWNECTVQLADGTGRAESHRLFGSIIERNGRFKVVSWAGEF